MRYGAGAARRRPNAARRAMAAKLQGMLDGTRRRELSAISAQEVDSNLVQKSKLVENTLPLRAVERPISPEFSIV
jgi:hypothetical protein